MLKTGNVVKINSGGLPMTVRNVTDKEVLCDWFDQTDQLRSSAFKPDTLVVTNDRLLTTHRTTHGMTQP